MTVHSDKWADLVGRKLFGIESVTAEEQSRMVRRCAKAVSHAVHAELKKCRIDTLLEAANHIDDLEYPKPDAPADHACRYDEQCWQIQDELSRMAREVENG